MTSAVNVAGGVEEHLGAARSFHTPAERARAWFISSYPLLGALAAAFTVIEDWDVCRRLGIAVAAVDAEAREIYVNPATGLTSSALLDEIVREGARKMLAAALPAEVDAYIAAFADERDGQGRRLVVRNGYHAPREILTAVEREELAA